MSTPETIKLCECGCGNPTPLARTGRQEEGRAKGQPLRFLPGHRRLVHPYRPGETPQERSLRVYREKQKRRAERLKARQSLPELPRGTTKECPGCKQVKPVTTEFFYRSKEVRDGFRPRCKECERSYYAKHADRVKERHGAKSRERMRESRRLFLRKHRERESIRHWTLKREMIEAYGGKCSCCGIAEIEFLTLEHVNGDGKAHRVSLGGDHCGGRKVWKDLKRRGWPREGFTVLCWNCNCARRYGHTCPHQRIGPWQSNPADEIRRPD